nr:hypothetical protein [Tanacetum cinerariifolium]
ARGDDDLVGHQFFHDTGVAHHVDGTLVSETAGSEEYVNAIARVVTGARRHLLVDDFFGVLQHIREREPARLANGPEHRVGVELNDLLDRVTQRLGRDRAQVSAVAADLPTAVDHGYLAP